MALLLKRRLLDLSMRQRTLARHLGRTDKWVSLVANDKKTPDKNERKAIAKALKCSQVSLWPKP